MYLAKMLSKSEVELKKMLFFFGKYKVMICYRSYHNLEIVHTSGNYINRYIKKHNSSIIEMVVRDI